jgi:hypothetical protein
MVTSCANARRSTSPWLDEIQDRRAAEPMLRQADLSPLSRVQSTHAFRRPPVGRDALAQPEVGYAVRA